MGPPPTLSSTLPCTATVAGFRVVVVGDAAFAHSALPVDDDESVDDAAAA